MDYLLQIAGKTGGIARLYAHRECERSRLNGENAYSTPTCAQFSWHLPWGKQTEFRQGQATTVGKKSLEKNQWIKGKKKSPQEKPRVNPKEKLVSESKRQTGLSVNVVVMLHEGNV